MTRVLDGAEVDALFSGASTSIERVETLERYTSTDDEPAALEAYRAEVRATTGRGVTWRRLRLLDTPLTAYQAWELEAYRENADAGETIAVAHQDPALPVRSDFWIFDGRVVVLMRYDEDGAVDALELVTDPGPRGALLDIARWLRGRATPLHEYLAAGEVARAS